MPPNPTTPMSRANQTCSRLSADSSPSIEAEPACSRNGTHRHTARTVTAPIAPTTRYGTCQPICWPSIVVSGTPMTLATDRPISIIDTAQVRRSRLTSDAATTAPTPKYAPCGRPDRNRVSISQP